jgi:hypothetical protein
MGRFCFPGYKKRPTKEAGLFFGIKYLLFNDYLTEAVSGRCAEMHRVYSFSESTDVNGSTICAI